MKYFPRKYQESQIDWFGKHGIPSHICVAFRKCNEQIQLLTFCHILKSCTQDRSTVLVLMANVIKQLKSTMPPVDSMFYQQDNAGCYRCRPALFAQSSTAANKVLRYGILIFPMEKGVRERVTTKRRQLRLTRGHTSRALMRYMMPWRYPIIECHALGLCSGWPSQDQWGELSFKHRLYHRRHPCLEGT